MNVTKAEFQRVFGPGYTESFEAVGYLRLKTELPKLIEQNSKGGTALDIGCGNGHWTKEWLVPRFDIVIALDVIQRPASMPGGFEFVEVDDCLCSQIADDSIDFVFSLGCLCHLSNKSNLAYLQSAYRVLKPGGKAILVFANWENHPGLTERIEFGKRECREAPVDGSLWFYNDPATVAEMAAQTGFKTFTDLIPGCRDLVALFSKA